MKRTNLVFFILTVLMAVSFTSCQKIEVTLTDVSFVVNVNVEELTTKDSGVAFGGSGIIDPSSSPELADYLDLIHHVEITEVKIKVISAEPATGLELNDVYFSLTDNVNQDNFTYEITSPRPIAVGTEFIIDSNSPNFNVVSDIINDLHEATVGIDGHVNQAGFVLGFEYAVKANITVGVPSGK